MEPFLSQVILFASSRIPTGWLVCNGATLKIEQYVSLFSLIGTTYGGNGTTDFNLPNLPPVGGVQYIICTTGNYPE